MALYRRTNDYIKDMRDMIEIKRITPFEWGKNDCVISVADVIAATTLPAYNVATDAYGQYSTKEGAEEWLQSHYGDLYAAWDHFFTRRTLGDWPEMGDPVLFMTDEGLTCGIADYNMSGLIIWAQGPRGMVAFTRTIPDVLASWEV